MEDEGDLVVPAMSIREILRRFPSTAAVFEKHGLGDCGGEGGPDEPLGWVASLEDRAKIYDMCNGVPGTACRVLRMALERTLRSGRTSIEWPDFESAFRAFNATEERALFDPFANGPKKETIGRLKAEAEAKKKSGGKDKEPA